MRVFVTFDVEIWCGGWHDLDARFPAAFERYIYGRSSAGEFALPATLEILARHGLHGVFFVDPLFAARFGVRHLATIVDLIASAGQEIQLHLHPEWSDETSPPLVPRTAHKRPHLASYSLPDQTELIRRGLQLLGEAGCRPVSAFRAGNYSCGRSTYAALAANGLLIDSSLNRCVAVSGIDLPAEVREHPGPTIDGVSIFPITTFIDGFGRRRHAQLSACSSGELAGLLEAAAMRGHDHVVLVSHNFELLRRGSSHPDPIMVKRFEAVCRYLAANNDQLPTAGLPAGTVSAGPPTSEPLRASLGATAWRIVQQGVRRVYR
jgi:hypothetical protein